MTHAPLLSVRGLRVDYENRLGFFRRGRPTTILDGLDLDIFPRETLGVVGESGSGKTTLLETLLQLRRPTEGTIRLAGHDQAAPRRERQRSWTRDVNVVFQNPFSSLDPRLRVADIVAEPLRVHSEVRGAVRTELTGELLERVGLSREHLRSYPHQLSGGQAQRVALARSLVLRPRLILLDEPTSALDVSVQAQVLNLLLELQEELGLTYLFVSHDLGVVQHISHRVAVMYLGQIVELGSTKSVGRAPRHPYTQALLAASALTTSLDGAVLGGSVPKFTAVPSGCRFHTRCPYVMDVCRAVEPPPYRVDSDGGFVRCHLLGDTHGGGAARSGAAQRDQAITAPAQKPDGEASDGGDPR